MGDLVIFQPPGGGSCNGYLQNGVIATTRHCIDGRFTNVQNSDQTISIQASSVQIIRRVPIPDLRPLATITLAMLNAHPARFHVAGINPQNGSAARKLLVDGQQNNFIGFPGWSGSPVIYAGETPGRYDDDYRIGSYTGFYPGRGGIFHILGLGHVTNLGGTISMYSYR